MKAFVNHKLKFALGRVENIVQKIRKCWFPAFSPFPTMFSKAFFSRGVKSLDCMVNSQGNYEENIKTPCK